MPKNTCINCSVKFASADIQREHYKTDWHRYNLKRRVAELPPVTADEFQARVIQIRNAEIDANKKKSLYCNTCRKYFGSERALAVHINGKNHKYNLVKFESENPEGKEITTKSLIQARPQPALVGKDKFALQQVAQNAEEEVNSDELDESLENPLSETECLFCEHKAEDIMDNLKHMSRTHSFFIPDLEYCTDLEGLLDYLGEKVAGYFICLWCSERSKMFYTLDAVRKHMKDKGHCQILHEGLALVEYAEYYDNSSRYPNFRGRRNIDEDVVPDISDGDEYEMVLPSGAVIGHRSLLRYYKQHLNPIRALVPKKSQRKLHHLLSTYRALGSTANDKNAAARKARDIHVMKQAQAKWQMKLSCRANKLQHHYRAQVRF